MQFVRNSIHQTEQYDPDTSQNRPLLPELRREGPKRGQAEHRIEQTVQDFINIADFGQGEAAAVLVRQEKNGPHDQGHGEHTNPSSF